MMLVQHNILVFRKANNRRDSVNKSESGMKKYLNDYAYLLIGLYLYGGALNLNADSLCTLEQTHTYTHTLSFSLSLSLSLPHTPPLCAP